MNLQQRIQVRIQQLECIEYSPRGSGEYAWHSSIAEDLKTLQSQNDRLVRALESLLAMHDDQMFICGQDDCGIVNKNLRAAQTILSEIKKGH